ncbi:MAG: winged helix-turn-helix domain-containing protein [Blastocatellia bacterium]
MSLPANHFYEFGPFRLDPGERVLFRDGRPLALPPKTFDTLIALVERSGHIVEKDELMEKVWPDTFVEEVNLARHVSNLRKTLGAGDEDQLYIETVARRGYRFVAKVRAVPMEAVEIDEGEELVVETHSLSHIVTDEEEVVEAEAIRIGRKPVAALSEGAVLRAPSGVEWVKRHKLAAALTLAAMVVAIGAGLYYWFNRDAADRAATAFKSVPLTSFPGVESEPAFSPDGSRIAFVWNGEKEDNFDIYVQLINAGPPLRLTSDPDRDIAPAWSPDGSHIAFTRVHGIAGSERTIFLIPAMGGAERKLLSISSAGESWLAARLSWSPDGKLLAFSGKESPQSMSSIFMLSTETLEQRQLLSPPAGYSDSNPAFSPDGKRLAFIRRLGTSSQEIYLAPTAGGEPGRLTYDNRTIDSVAWTPDGRALVFTSDRSGLNSLWRISASGGAPERLAVGGENVHDAALARPVDRLAYSQELADTNIWQWEEAGSAGRRKPPIKLIASTRIDTNAQYSPDGRKIAFVSDRSGSMEVWVCGSDGSSLVRLTHFNGPFVGSPRWSADGRQIAFDCVAGNPRDIYIVSAEGGPARRFTTEVCLNLRSFSISPHSS